MMDFIDRLAYRIKQKLPWVYGMASWSARFVTLALYGRRIARARRQAHVEGTVCGSEAVMRAIGAADLDAMMAMLETMPEKHLEFFHPHGLDRQSVRKVLARRDMMTYGLLVEGKMQSYALFKLFPTRKAYIGRLVAPAMTGLGIGRFLSRFLYWQATLLKFQPCSTIHVDNMASLKSHAAVRPYSIVAKLPKGFQLIRFSLMPEDGAPPQIDIVRRDD